MITCRIFFLPFLVHFAAFYLFPIFFIPSLVFADYFKCHHKPVIYLSCIITEKAEGKQAVEIVHIIEFVMSINAMKYEETIEV